MSKKKNHQRPSASPMDHTILVDVKGKNFPVDIDVFNDLYFLERVQSADQGNILVFREIIMGLFGDNTEAVFKQLENERGRLPLGEITKFINDLGAKVAPKLESLVTRGHTTGQR